MSRLDGDVTKFNEFVKLQLNALKARSEIRQMTAMQQLL